MRIKRELSFLFRLGVWALPLLLQCTGTGAGTGTDTGGASFYAPRVDGEAVQGAINIKNARVTCGFKNTISSSIHVIDCHAATVDAQGNIVSANSIEKNTSLKWNELVSTSGASIQTQNCTVDKTGLAQECEVTLIDGLLNSAEVKASLTITDTSTQTSAEEFAIVYLPYSIRTYGAVPAVPLTVSSNKKDTNHLSFFNRSFDSNIQLFGQINTACEMGGKIYFATNHFIYVLEDGKVRLVAGSSNNMNSSEYSHPLRNTLSLGLNRIFLGCGKEALYVAGYNKLLRISETSITKLSVPTIKGLDPVKNVANPLLDPYNFAVKNENTFYILDKTYHRVVRIFLGSENLPAESTIIAGTGTAGYSGDGGLATQAALDTPSAIGIGSDGTLFIGEKTGERIRKISPNGIISTFASFPTGYYFHGIQDGWQPGIVVNEDGSLYYPDEKHGNHLIYIDALGQISQISTPSVGTANTGVTGLTKCSQGLLLTGKESNSVFSLYSLWLRSPDGSIKKLVGNPPKPEDYDKLGIISNQVNSFQFGPDDSLVYIDKGILRQIRSDGTGVTVDDLNRISPPPSLSPFLMSMNLDYAYQNDGTLYIATDRNLYKRDAEGNLTLYGGGGTTLGDGGPVSQASFSSIIAIALDPLDNSLYVADQIGARIRKVSSNGIVSTIAGTGTSGYSGDEGPATLAKFDSISQIILSNDRRLFVMGKSTIRQIDLNTGIVTRIAGDPTLNTLTPFTEGQWSLNLVIQSMGIQATPMAYSPDGKILYAVGTNRIRMLVPEMVAGVKKYRTYTYFDGSKQKDCGSGALEGTVNKSEQAAKIKASLGHVCIGTIVSLKGRFNCSSSEGKVSVAFLQKHWGDSGYDGQIVRVDRPCGDEDLP